MAQTCGFVFRDERVASRCVWFEVGALKRECRSLTPSALKIGEPLRSNEKYRRGEQGDIAIAYPAMRGMRALDHNVGIVQAHCAVP